MGSGVRGKEEEERSTGFPCPVVFGLIYLFIYLLRQTTLYSSQCHGTHYVAPTILELKESFSPLFPEYGLLVGVERLYLALKLYRFIQVSCLPFSSVHTYSNFPSSQMFRKIDFVKKHNFWAGELAQ